jgi:glycosyltransferase involved in cell wall biosynthesis
VSGPLRVLHVYSGNLYGGIETLLATLARLRGLAPGMEPHFALCFAGRLRAELEAAGAPVHMLGPARASRPGSVLRARRRLKELLRMGGFGAVVCHSAWAQALFGPVARRAGVPLVFWLHDAASGTHWLERWARLTPPVLAICNSRFTASTLPRLFPHTPAEILTYPVESAPGPHPDGRTEIRRGIGTPPGTVVVVQVSRLEPYKGHRLHLEALGRLRDVPGWECWQVGGAQRPEEAAYLEELRATAARLGIGDRVRFLGQRSDVRALLPAADVHCQPNVRAEPFGITFLEALYSGLPLVTTALGGALEIVTPDCGVLVPPGDAAALADTLHALIRDGEARRRMGAAAPLRARTLCDPQAQLAALHGLLAAGRTEMVR